MPVYCRLLQFALGATALRLGACLRRRPADGVAENGTLQGEAFPVDGDIAETRSLSVNHAHSSPEALSPKWLNEMKKWSNSTVPRSTGSKLSDQTSESPMRRRSPRSIGNVPSGTVAKTKAHSAPSMRWLGSSDATDADIPDVNITLGNHERLAHKVAGCRDPLGTPAQMACLAVAVTCSPPISKAGPWTLVNKTNIFHDQDHIAVYAKNDTGKRECALVFTGSKNSHDGKTNLNFAKMDICGMKGVHSGFAKRIKKIIELLLAGSNHSATSLNWFLQLLKPDACDSVTTVGHSLGGAMASIMAVCANRYSEDGLFPVHATYTFGAPRLVGRTNSQPLNGMRYFNRDAWQRDPVPAWPPSFMGWRHLNTPATALEFGGVGGGYVIETEYRMGSKTTMRTPKDTSYKFLFGGAPRMESMAMHKIKEYARRLTKASKDEHELAAEG